MTIIESELWHTIPSSESSDVLFVATLKCDGCGDELDCCTDTDDDVDAYSKLIEAMKLHDGEWKKRPDETHYHYITFGTNDGNGIMPAFCECCSTKAELERKWREHLALVRDSRAVPMTLEQYRQSEAERAEEAV